MKPWVWSLALHQPGQWYMFVIQTPRGSQGQSWLHKELEANLEWNTWDPNKKETGRRTGGKRERGGRGRREEVRRERGEKEERERKRKEGRSEGREGENRPTKGKTPRWPVTGSRRAANSIWGVSWTCLFCVRLNRKGISVSVQTRPSQRWE